MPLYGSRFQFGFLLLNMKLQITEAKPHGTCALCVAAATDGGYGSEALSWTGGWRWMDEYAQAWA